MAEFFDYLEATTGTAGDIFRDDDDCVADDSDGEYESASQRTKRDMILCLVDARGAMFRLKDPTEQGVAASGWSPTARSLWPHSRPTGHSDNSTATSMTPFALAMRAIRGLYQSKLVTGDRDLLGLILYNTAKSRNECGLPGVHVLQPPAVLDAMRMREVGQLEMAGTVSTPAYEQFLTDIGHRQVDKPAALAEVLGVAKHTFAALGPHAATHRRMFLFTNDVDPSHHEADGGTQGLLQQCVHSLLEMRTAGIALELFALWKVETPDKADEIVAKPAPLTTAAQKRAGSAADHTGDHCLLCSRQDRFWGPLLLHDTDPAKSHRSMHVQLYQTGVPTATTTYAHTHSNTSGLAFNATTTTSPHARADDLLHEVMLRVHPQRVVTSCTIAIGARADGGAVPRMAVSVYAPIMAVRGPATAWLSAETNALMKRDVRLTRKGTEAMHRAADTVGTGWEETKEGKEREGLRSVAESRETTQTLRPEEVCHGVAVGGLTLPFTREERVSIARVAAAGAAPGFTILCFKPLDDAVKFSHALDRSTFLHANLRRGGEGSLRAFVQLVRTLRRQGKAAIAQHVRHKYAAPRLVALVPSSPPPLSTMPSDPDTSGGMTDANGYEKSACVPSLWFPPDSLPAEGIGLYVVPLPYADDIRPLPPPDPKTPVWSDFSKDSQIGDEEGEGVSVSRGMARRGSRLPAEGLRLAKKIISALTVAYDISAVGNPSVQLQYRTLERLIKQHQDAATGASTSSQVDGDGEDGRHNEVVASKGFTIPSTKHDPTLFQDFTQPDWEGMARYTKLFQAFKDAVVTPGYDAEALCPQPRQPLMTADPSRRRTHDAYEDDASARTRIEELIRHTAESDSWQQLTVEQLRECLKQLGVPGLASKRKVSGFKGPSLPIDGEAHSRLASETVTMSMAKEHLLESNHRQQQQQQLMHTAHCSMASCGLDARSGRQPPRAASSADSCVADGPAALVGACSRTEGNSTAARVGNASRSSAGVPDEPVATQWSAASPGEHSQATAHPGTANPNTTTTGVTSTATAVTSAHTNSTTACDAGTRINKHAHVQHLLNSSFTGESRSALSSPTSNALLQAEEAEVAIEAAMQRALAIKRGLQRLQEALAYRERCPYQAPSHPPQLAPLLATLGPTGAITGSLSGSAACSLEGMRDLSGAVTSAVSLNHLSFLGFSPTSALTLGNTHEPCRPRSLEDADSCPFIAGSAAAASGGADGNCMDVGFGFNGTGRGPVLSPFERIRVGKLLGQLVLNIAELSASAQGGMLLSASLGLSTSEPGKRDGHSQPTVPSAISTASEAQCSPPSHHCFHTLRLSQADGQRSDAGKEAGEHGDAEGHEKETVAAAAAAAADDSTTTTATSAVHQEADFQGAKRRPAAPAAASPLTPPVCTAACASASGSASSLQPVNSIAGDPLRSASRRVWGCDGVDAASTSTVSPSRRSRSSGASNPEIFPMYSPFYDSSCTLPTSARESTHEGQPVRRTDVLRLNDACDATPSSPPLPTGAVATTNTTLIYTAVATSVSGSGPRSVVIGSFHDSGRAGVEGEGCSAQPVGTVASDIPTFPSLANVWTPGVGPARTSGASSERRVTEAEESAIVLQPYLRDYLLPDDDLNSGDRSHDTLHLAQTQVSSSRGGHSSNRRDGGRETTAASPDGAAPYTRQAASCADSVGPADADTTAATTTGNAAVGGSGSATLSGTRGGVGAHYSAHRQSSIHSFSRPADTGSRGGPLEHRGEAGGGVAIDTATTGSSASATVRAGGSSATLLTPPRVPLAVAAPLSPTPLSVAKAISGGGEDSSLPVAVRHAAVAGTTTATSRALSSGRSSPSEAVHGSTGNYNSSGNLSRSMSLVRRPRRLDLAGGNTQSLLPVSNYYHPRSYSIPYGNTSSMNSTGKGNVAQGDGLQRGSNDGAVSAGAGRGHAMGNGSGGHSGVPAAFSGRSVGDLDSLTSDTSELIFKRVMSMESQYQSDDVMFSGGSANTTTRDDGGIMPRLDSEGTSPHTTASGTMSTCPLCALTGPGTIAGSGGGYGVPTVAHHGRRVSFTEVPPAATFLRANSQCSCDGVNNLPSPTRSPPAQPAFAVDGPRVKEFAEMLDELRRVLSEFTDADFKETGLCFAIPGLGVSDALGGRVVLFPQVSRTVGEGEGLQSPLTSPLGSSSGGGGGGGGGSPSAATAAAASASALSRQRSQTLAPTEGTLGVADLLLPLCPGGESIPVSHGNFEYFYTLVTSKLQEVERALGRPLSTL